MPVSQDEFDAYMGVPVAPEQPAQPEIPLAEAFGAGFRNVITGGFGDEASGAINYALNRGAPGSYEAGAGPPEAKTKAAAAQSPIAYGAGQLTGGVAGSAIPVGAATRAASLPVQMAKTALTGAAEGGLYGAGEAEGGLMDRARGAVQGAAWGAAAGPAGVAVGRGIGKMWGALPKVPSFTDLGRIKTTLYRQAEDAGVYVNANTTSNLFGRLQQKLLTENADPVNEAGTIAKINAFEKGLKNPNISFMQIDDLRSALGGIAGKGGPDGRMASVMRKEIDDFTAGLTPNNVTGSLQDARSFLTEARKANTRYRSAETIDDAMSRAKNSASWRNGNQNEAIQNEFRKIANDKDAMRFLTPNQRASVLMITRAGGPKSGQYVQRLLSKLAPQGAVSGGISASLGAAAGGYLGQHLGLDAATAGTIGAGTAFGLGEAMRRRIGSQAQRAVEDLQANVATGRKIGRVTTPAERRGAVLATGVTPMVQEEVPLLPPPIY